MNATIKEKYLAICNTLMTNTASVRFRPIIMQMLKADAEQQRTAKKRSSDAYDRAAAAYYKKHGTVGEY